MSKVFNIVMQGGGSAAELAVNTTWAELKTMRDNSQLTVGCLYRITDYETIISGEDVQSAGHVFDIIVLATDVNVLSEDAMAVHSERDTVGYFANSKLEAWELKYCLDNDTSRFAWASEGGERWVISILGLIIYASLVSTDDSTYEGFPFKFIGNVQGMAVELYFAHLELQEGEEIIPNKMVIGGEVQENAPITQITHNNTPEGKGVIWHMKDEFNNSCYYDFKNVLFKRYLIISTEDNPTGAFHGKYAAFMPNLPDDYLPENYIVDAENYKFLYTFSTIVTDTDIVKDSSVPFGINQVPIICTNNVIKSYQQQGMNVFHLNKNVFVSSIDDMINVRVEQAFNTFDCNSFQNTFIDGTTYITFEEEVQYNMFADNSYMILFKKRCSQNLLGENAFFVEFGFACTKNILDDNCENISFKDLCREINIVANSRNINIGKSCFDISIEPRISCVMIDNGVFGITIKSDSPDISDFHILAGVYNKTITINQSQCLQMVGLDSQGDLKIWNPADLVQA